MVFEDFYGGGCYTTFAHFLMEIGKDTCRAGHAMYEVQQQSRNIDVVRVPIAAIESFACRTIRFRADTFPEATLESDESMQGLSRSQLHTWYVQCKGYKTAEAQANARSTSRIVNWLSGEGLCS